MLIDGRMQFGSGGLGVAAVFEREIVLLIGLVAEGRVMVSNYWLMFANEHSDYLFDNSRYSLFLIILPLYLFHRAFLTSLNLRFDM